MQGIPLSVYGYALIAMPYGLPVLPLHFRALPLVAIRVVTVQPMALCLATADKSTRFFYGVSLGNGSFSLYHARPMRAISSMRTARRFGLCCQGTWPLGCGPVGLVDGDMVTHGMANVQYGLLMAIPAIHAISISPDYSRAGNGHFLRNN